MRKQKKKSARKKKANHVHAAGSTRAEALREQPIRTTRENFSISIATLILLGYFYIHDYSNPYTL